MWDSDKKVHSNGNDTAWDNESQKLKLLQEAQFVLVADHSCEVFRAVCAVTALGADEADEHELLNQAMSLGSARLTIESISRCLRAPDLITTSVSSSSQSSSLKKAAP